MRCSVNTGTEWTDPGSFQEPGAGPGSTGHNTLEIYDDAKTQFDQCDATADQVGAGVTFFSTAGGSWGPTLGTGIVSTGNAAAGGVLEGMTFSNATAAGILGTMPDREGDNASTARARSAGVNYFTGPEGYYDGGDRVSATDAQVAAMDTDLTDGNIRSGVNIFGVTGDSNVVNTGSGDAVSGDILSGKKAWVDGGEVTGNIVTRSVDDTTVNQLTGYYNAFDLSAIDPDLASGNIRSGVSIYGKAGNANVVNTGSGDAVSGDILSGKKAWVDGGEVTGNILTRSVNPGTVSQLAGYYNAFNLSAIDPALASGNIKSGIYIYGVPGSSVVVNTSSGNATVGDIRAGKKAWVAGNEVNGGIVTRTVVNSTVNQLSGYYDAFDLSAIDPALAAGNIKTGVSLYGVAGTYLGSGASAGKTGQIECYEWDGIDSGTIPCSNPGGPGQDGDLQKGVTWPAPRFTNNGNGTVTDNLTGLVWLKNANCFGAELWVNALTECNNLSNGECGLTDGSEAGDWRLPNIKELLTLIDYAYDGPALSNAAGTGQWTNGNAFTNVQKGEYWSNTTYLNVTIDKTYTNTAWTLSLDDGRSNNTQIKRWGNYAWPVRDGE